MTAIIDPYDQGYRDGWHDIHISTRQRRARRRRSSETRTTESKGEYALGYRHGRVDGAAHPSCPDWDDGHRAGSVRDLPVGCPWEPRTEALTRGWSPLADGAMDSGGASVGDIRRRAAILGKATHAISGFPAQDGRDAPTCAHLMRGACPVCEAVQARSSAAKKGTATPPMVRVAVREEVRRVRVDAS